MTTDYCNPEYFDNFSRFKRLQPMNETRMGTCDTTSQNVRALLSQSLNPRSLEEIRRQSREAWSHASVANETSYQDHYRNRFKDVGEPTTSRPFEPTRRHKPHPSGVFLTTRLHQVPGDRMQAVPGFHNPDATMGKDAYRVDSSVSLHEQKKRADLRTKYIGRPESSALRPYQVQEELEAIHDPVDRQASEAWLKLASDKENVLDSLRLLKPDLDRDLISAKAREVRPYRPKTVPSLHRYGREAGFEERTNVQDLHKKQLYGSYPDFNSRPCDVVTLRNIDLLSTRNARYIHKSKKGDFAIHPEWPPTMPHHRLNGLSSVDIPYLPGRR